MKNIESEIKAWLQCNRVEISGDSNSLLSRHWRELQCVRVEISPITYHNMGKMQRYVKAFYRKIGTKTATEKCVAIRLVSHVGRHERIWTFYSCGGGEEESFLIKAINNVTSIEDLLPDPKWE